MRLKLIPAGRRMRRPYGVVGARRDCYGSLSKYNRPVHAVDAAPTPMYNPPQQPRLRRTPGCPMPPAHPLQAARNRRLAAYHEAGHAVVIWKTGGQVLSASIIGNGSGVVAFTEPPHDDDRLAARKAGETAEILYQAGRGETDEAASPASMS